MNYISNVSDASAYNTVGTHCVSLLRESTLWNRPTRPLRISHNGPNETTTACRVRQRHLANDGSFAASTRIAAPSKTRVPQDVGHCWCALADPLVGRLALL